MKFLFLWSALLLTSLCSSAPHKTGCNSQASCLTPWGNPGTCIFLIHCEHLLNALTIENRKLVPTFDFLPSFFCGKEGKTPKYCCDDKDEERIKNHQLSPPAETRSYQPASYPPDVSDHKNLKLLNEDICGKRVHEKRGKIFEYPWMALLVYENKRNKLIQIRCGGAVINNRYVLTAAHCVTDHPNNDTLIGVRLGVENWSKIRHCSKEPNDVNEFCVDYQDIYIESSEYHPQFSRSTLKNDIALLRLERMIDFRQGNVRPICLPIGTARILTKRNVVITGWGITESGPRNNQLFDSVLPLVPNDKCAKIYEGYRKIEKTQMCVGEENHKKCIGDDGGPLQNTAKYRNEFRYVLYGVKNFGYDDCYDERYPTVYTRVNYYMDWILDMIRE